MNVNKQAFDRVLRGLLKATPLKREEIGKRKPRASKKAAARSRKNR